MIFRILRLRGNVRTRCAAAALVASLALPLPAHAEAESFHAALAASGVACFARSYDSQHLATHPRQRLTRFSLRESTLGNPVAPGSFAVSLAFALKGSNEPFQSEAFCEDAVGTVHCHLEADGGRFTMRADGPNLLLTIERIEVEGPESFSPDLAEGGDDRVVRLFPSPAETCPGD